MATTPFLSGPYLWTFGALDHDETDVAFQLGVVEDAPTFRFSREGDPIVGDNLGAAIQDVVDRGGSLFIDMILQELAGDAVSKAWWPYDTVLGRVTTATAASIGRLNAPAELRATKLLPLLSPILEEHLNLLRFERAIIAPGFDITQLLGSRLRNVPMSFLCTPFAQRGATNQENTLFWGTDPGKPPT